MDCRARGISVEKSHLQNITPYQFGRPTRYQAGRRRQTPSWYSETWQSSQDSDLKEHASYKERSRQHTQGQTSDTGGASARRDGAGRQEAGEKEKCRSSEWATSKTLNIAHEELWELQKILDRKKASLRKTYKTQAEANDNVPHHHRKLPRAEKTSKKETVMTNEVEGNKQLKTAE